MDSSWSDQAWGSVCRVSKSYAMYAQRAEAVYGIPSSSSFHSPSPLARLSSERENGMRGGGDRFRFSSGILRPSRQWAGGAANGQRNTRPSSATELRLTGKGRKEGERESRSIWAMRWIERREGENRVWNCLNLRCCAGHLLRHLPIDTKVMKFKTKYQTCLFLTSPYSLH